MKQKNLPVLFLLLFIVAFTFQSCKEEVNETANSSMLTSTAENEVQASAINDQILSEVDQYVGTSMQSVKPQTNIRTTTVPVVNADNSLLLEGKIKYIIDFGLEGFQGKHKNILKGKLIVIISFKNLLVDMDNPFFWVGASRTITYDNFYINGIKVSGTNTISFKGYTVSQHPVWTATSDNSFVDLDGKSISWKAERSIEFTNVSLMWGTNYTITGKASGVNKFGKSYTMVIKDSNPLCGTTLYPHITKGILLITIENNTGILDYGNGEQDNKATMTYNGILFPFEMD